MWIKGKVEKIIDKHKTNNPYEIATSKNINVIFWDLHHEIKGFYKYDKRNKYIVINNNLDERTQRFVCSHELGHSQLHPRVNTPFLREKTFFSVDKIEVEANTFAVELMLPDEVIHQYNDGNLSIDEVASIYGVPHEVAHLKKISRSDGSCLFL